MGLCLFLNCTELSGITQFLHCYLGWFCLTHLYQQLLTQFLVKFFCIMNLELNFLEKTINTFVLNSSGLMPDVVVFLGVSIFNCIVNFLKTLHSYVNSQIFSLI